MKVAIIAGHGAAEERHYAHIADPLATRPALMVSVSNHEGQER